METDGGRDHVRRGVTREVRGERHDPERRVFSVTPKFTSIDAAFASYWIAARQDGTSADRDDALTTFFAGAMAVITILIDAAVLKTEHPATVIERLRSEIAIHIEDISES